MNSPTTHPSPPAKPLDKARRVSGAAHELMQRVLDLKDARFIDASKVESIAKSLGILDIEARIYFLRELHGIVRKLPLKIYNDDQDRLRFVTAIQEALDQAIDDEDEDEEDEE